MNGHTQADSREHVGGEDELHQATCGRIQVAGTRHPNPATTRLSLDLGWHTFPTTPRKMHAHHQGGTRAHAGRHAVACGQAPIEISLHP